MNKKYFLEKGIEGTNDLLNANNNNNTNKNKNNICSKK